MIGWSGDAVQLQADNPNIEWRMPTEGCMLWSDNMVIPVGAPNPTAAEAFMNYVYDPKNQAQIADYVNYVTPVEGRQGDPRRSATRSWPKNQLIFPSEQFTKKCSTRRRPLERRRGAEGDRGLRRGAQRLSGWRRRRTGGEGSR